MPPFFMGIPKGQKCPFGKVPEFGKILVYLAIPEFGVAEEMAHLEKFTRGSVHGILAHNERNKPNGKYKNIDIDNSKTHLNYSYLNNEITAEMRLKNRLENVEIYKRSDVNILASWVVTLPQNVEQKDQKRFFDSVFEYMEKSYGKNNIISANVHNDETTPHIHICFVPVVPNNKKNAKFAEKISAKDLLTRSHLQHFHDDLNKYVSKKLGYDAGILNGATKQNKTVNEMKSEMRNELDKLQNIGKNTSEKKGIFGKIILSNDEYNILKNGANEIKKLTNEYIQTKNGERIKNVLAENEKIKKQYNELYNLADNKIKEYKEKCENAEKQTKQIKHESDLIHNLNMKLRNENKQLKDQNDVLIRAIQSVRQYLTDTAKAALAAVGIGRSSGRSR